MRLEAKGDEFELVDREYKKLQERHREASNAQYNLQTAKEHLEQSVRVLQEDLQKVASEYEENAYRWKRERQELVQRVGEMQNVEGKAREEAATLKVKCRQYKDKLRLANTSIKTLAGKVAQYEMERVGTGNVASLGGGPTSEEIRVGSLNIEGGGRESHHSGRGSDLEIKEAVQRVI